MPRAAPTGSRMPPWNGFDSVSMNVKPVVERDVERRRLAEPAADDVAAPLPEEPVEHPVAAADDGLVVELEREADARHEVVLRRLDRDPRVRR